MFFLDFLFPQRCVGCQREGEMICAGCLEKIQVRTMQRCPGCHRPVREGRLCGQCDGVGLDQLVSACCYRENPLLRRLIHRFKYHYSAESALILGRVLLRTQAMLPRGREPCVVVPVPLHARRLRQRGFNQAARLAAHVGRTLHIRYLDCMVRKVYTPPQAQLSRGMRLALSSQVFSVKEGVSLQGTSCILVDDVSTTGATLNACAVALKQARATSVCGLVLAGG